MNPFDLVIVTNSAGELSAYVKPTVEEIHKKIPRARIILVLTPCQYATGREIEEARSYPGISEVVLPQEYSRWILKGRGPLGISFRDRGLVLYMGGDFLHAVLIAKKLKFKAIAYTQKSAHWTGKFLSIFVPDQTVADKLIKKGIPENKVRIVGDLMVDSVPASIDKDIAASRWDLDLSKPVISMMPGSRPFQTDYMLPFFLDCARMIQKIIPDVQILMILSPFVNEDDVRRAMKTEGAIYSHGDLRFIQAKKGGRARMISSFRHEAIAISKLVVTIPGTNTAQVASLGVPMLVVFPMDRPERIPLEGMVDLLCRLPFLGMVLKKFFVKVVDARTKFFALPNIRANKEIVPELRGRVSTKEVASKVVYYLKDNEWREETSKKLKEAMGERGASSRIAQEISKLMEGSQ